MKIIKLLFVGLIFFGLSQNLISQTNWFSKGEKFLVENKFDNAVEAFTKVIAEDSTNNAAFYNRGLAYLYLMKLDEALFDLSHFISNDTTVSDAYNNRGLAYNIIGQFESAVIDFNKAISLDSTFAQAYTNRGASYMSMRNNISAMRDFSKAIEIDKKNPAPYYQRGLVYYQEKNYNKAISDFSKSIELGLNNGKVYYNRANSYYNTEQFEKAVKDYDKALKDNPKDVEALNNRAMAYDKLGKTDKAKKDREKLSTLVNTKNYYPPVDSLKFVPYSDSTGQITISLPENWYAVFSYEDSTVTMTISEEKITSDTSFYSVGIRMTFIKNMFSQYQIKGTQELLEFWEGSIIKNSADYYQYDIFTKKIFSKAGFSGFLKKVNLKATSESQAVRMYELALAKEGMILFGFFQSPEPVFAYYQEIFDKAIDSLVLK